MAYLRSSALSGLTLADAAEAALQALEQERKMLKTTPANRRIMGSLLSLAALAILAVACGADTAPTPTQPAVADNPSPTVTDTPAGPIAVVTTIYPITWLAEQIGGDRVSVESLVKPGVDAHDFEPTPGDLLTLSRADVFIYNHSSFETWALDALNNIENNPPIAIQAADLPEDIEIEHGHDEEEEEHDEAGEEHGDEEEEHDESEQGRDDEEEEHDEAGEEHGDEEEEHDESEQGRDDEEEEHDETGEEHGDEEEEHDEAGEEHGDEEEEHGEQAVDPHVWLDPTQAVSMVRRIQEGFTNADPAGAAVYKSNADALAVRLNDLDGQFQDALESCGSDHVVVSHLAYGHLAERYGLEQIGLAGLSAEFESGPRRIAEIVDRMEELGIKYILEEPVSGSGLSDTVAAEAGAQTLTLHPMESLTPDEVAAGEDYFSIMDKNIETLKLALECTP